MRGQSKGDCTRKADFELLAAEQLKKTIQTVAMRYGIDIEEDTVAAHADNGECNVYPAELSSNLLALTWCPLQIKERIIHEISIPGGCSKSSTLSVI